MNLQTLTGKKWLLAMILGLFVSVISLFISQTPPFQILEYKVTDWLFQMRGPVGISDSPVVLVAISDQSDYELDEPWPWPRSYHARLVDNLNAAGAKVIGFDVTFIQPDVYSLQNDSLFAEAIKRHGNVVLAGDARTERRSGRSELHRLLPPNRLLQQDNSNAWGAISIPTDRDGFIRRYVPAIRHQDTHYFTFAFELIRNYLDLDTLTLRHTGSHYDLGFVRIPVYKQEGMLINYYGGSGTFPEFQYDQIIDDSGFLLSSDRDFFGITDPDEKDYGTFDDPEFGLLYSGDLKDKIVIVGATIPELQDFHATPVSPRLPGFEIQANAIQTILSEGFITHIAPSLILVLMIIIGFTISFLTIYKGVVSGFVLLLILSPGLLAGCYFLFSSYHIRMDLVGPMLALLVGFTFSTTYSFITEQREKRRIRKMFGSYVSPEVVNAIIESGKEPRLGGNEVYMTAFFSDIRSFSTISEKLPPAQLVDLMNEYLSSMTEIIIQERGTLDKYIGDAIVAFFGAPVMVEDHALRACVTSQLMQLNQQELRKRWKEQKRPWPDVILSMTTRIGINTGWMITGNMGSSTRFNYTMMGDNVNLAARCESAAEIYGVDTMVTEETKQEAEKFGDDCVFRFLDKVVVKGRSQPVRIYEIAGLRSMIDPGTLQCIEVFEAGMAEYMNQRWDKAIQLFSESMQLEPHLSSSEVKTNPSKVLIDRCQKMKAYHPGDNWDGVYVMKSK